jgi:hypothetical protein
MVTNYGDEAAMEAATMADDFPIEEEYRRTARVVADCEGDR